MTDSKELYDEIVDVFDKWPSEYRSKIKFQYVAETYPHSRIEMRNMFRLCATERLFIPDILHDEDAVIYIDTDFIFMTPPEELWSKFDNFDALQHAAMAPCLARYSAKRHGRTVSIGSYTIMLKCGLNRTAVTLLVVGAGRRNSITTFVVILIVYTIY